MNIRHHMSWHDTLQGLIVNPIIHFKRWISKMQNRNQLTYTVKWHIVDRSGDLHSGWQEALMRPKKKTMENAGLKK